MALHIEEIPDNEIVSRSIEFPHMYDPISGKLSDLHTFAFPSNSGYPNGRPESVIWRRYVPSIRDVHAIGLAKVARDNVERELGKQKEYRGVISSTVGSIRRVQNRRGHGLDVEHEPSEAPYHAQVFLRIADGQELKKVDKAELRMMLFQCFSPVEPAL